MIVPDIARDLLAYDPDTGVITWRVAPPRKPFLLGREAGAPHPTLGYRYLKIEGRRYAAHQVAWFLHTGENIPDGLETDHINRVRDDNRAANLRLVTRSQNVLNTALKPNRTGVRGVSVHPVKGVFRARFRGKVVYSRSLDGAAAAYAAMVASASP